MDDVFVSDSWFPRNERKSKWSLSDEYIKRDNSGNNVPLMDFIFITDGKLIGQEHQVVGKLGGLSMVLKQSLGTFWSLEQVLTKVDITEY